MILPLNIFVVSNVESVSAFPSFGEFEFPAALHDTGSIYLD